MLIRIPDADAVLFHLLPVLSTFDGNRFVFRFVGQDGNIVLILDPGEQFINMFNVNRNLNMGLFHESQHNTPQSLFCLYDMSSIPHICSSNSNGTDPCSVVRRCATSFEQGHLSESWNTVISWLYVPALSSFE